MNRCGNGLESIQSLSAEVESFTLADRRPVVVGTEPRRLNNHNAATSEIRMSERRVCISLTIEQARSVLSELEVGEQCPGLPIVEHAWRIHEALKEIRSSIELYDLLAIPLATDCDASHADPLG